VWELRGIPCLDIDEVAPTKQSLMTSRAFGRPILSFEELTEALCSFAAYGGEKLRQEGSLASWLQVFTVTNGRNTENCYGNQAYLVLPEPSDYTPTLLDYTVRGVKAIFRSEYVYKKGGVLLGGLVPNYRYQQDLFVEHDPDKERRRKTAMTLLDQANTTFGYPILKFAAEGTSRPWQRKREALSPSFTTRWSDLLIIKI
jgi:DNA polymerase V